MNPNDASPSAVDLNATSLALLSMREAVLYEWERRVSLSIPEASRLETPIVLDSIPALFANLAEALTPEYPREFATSGTNLGTAHGQDRASMTSYKPADLVHELQMFRQVIFDMANASKLELNLNECHIVSQSIEMAIIDAITAFTISHNQIGDAFIASLSHDLRNPLNVAKVSSQMIQNKSTEERVVSLARRVCVKLSEVDAMIQSFLDTSALNGQKKLKLHIISFDMVELVNEVCTDTLLTVSARIHSPGPVVGYWCRVTMRRLLENLLSNAQKYGDKIHPIDAHVDRIDDRLMLAIHNEGRPIPQQEFEKIFHSYHRLEHFNVKGWGLGLPFVQTVAECHGGAILVDSAEGRGTTFTVNIPIDCRPYA